jgi:hypothetical protein
MVSCRSFEEPKLEADDIANGRFGAEEAGLPVSDELRQNAAGAGHSRRQHLRQGKLTACHSKA